MIAYIIFEAPAEDRNINTLVDMISGMDVKEDDESYMNAVDYMFKGLEKRKPDCFAVKQYKKYKLASGKTAKSILISCGSRLAPFDIPQLREIMSYDELELDRIGDRKTAVFFTISDTTPTYNFIVALAFSQMFNLLCERADNVHGGRLPHHVRVLWDEAANTGQVPSLEKLVAVIRSREVSLCLFYQQYAQCKAIYKDNAETILGNMDSVIFLGGRESSTIKEISENWLGKATISMQTEGRSRGQSESYNQNTQRLGRELMTPSELATMPGDKCILQLRGLPPFFSSKYDLKQHPNYKYTAEADKKKNAFDLDKLINRRRRPGLTEACEVYEVDVSEAGARKRGRGHPQLRRRGRSGCLCINHFWTKCPEVATCRPSDGGFFHGRGTIPEKWRLYAVLSLPLSTTLQTLGCGARRWPGRVGRCQSPGGLRLGQPWLQKPGHEAAHGGRRHHPAGHHPDPSAERPVLR